ncbi:MAG: hypothetical protein K2N63_16235 [Lachnospiraceae bacterium]|nr:hypothetical protein [Lachnospiraceae bacterium]
MFHGHLEYMPLKANPMRAEKFARQQIRYCRKQLRYYRRYRIKKSFNRLWTILDRLYPLLVLLGAAAAFSTLVVLSAL